MIQKIMYITVAMETESSKNLQVSAVYIFGNIYMNVYVYVCICAYIYIKYRYIVFYIPIR